jgi:hypothetical protein
MSLKTGLKYALWVAGITMLLYGAAFHAFDVLDKPLFRDAAKKGVTIEIYSEARLASAVSTDKVELTREGILQTRPDTGFCES